ncbi:MAG: HAD hydrolase family protein [Saccharofermentans sp.]|nr:HAD hydrolase family protein [Saccharofermentans sp.]
MNKLFITHCFYPGTDLWKNIMLLPDEALSKVSKIRTEDMAAFGDVSNDVEMLSMCGK